MDEIAIRKATPADCPVLAKIHFAAYYTRFFDANALDIQGNPYGAPLAAEHPTLARGQTQEYFDRYWNKFGSSLWNNNERTNLCFVATLSGREVGFVKGNAAAASVADYPVIRDINGNIGELGSIYMLPDVKLRGAGQQLVRRYAAELVERGFDQMVTSAYYKNDSPAFFEKMGAKVLGGCDIPNEYIDYDSRDKNIAIENIGGTLLYWSPEAFRCLQVQPMGRPVVAALQSTSIKMEVCP